MNRKLTIFFSANLFQQRKILLLKIQQKKVLPDISLNIEQNSSPVKFSIYFKRITKTFNQKLTFWETIVNICFRYQKQINISIQLYLSQRILFFFPIELMLMWTNISLFKLLLGSDFKWFASVHNFQIYIRRHYKYQ